MTEMGENRKLAIEVHDLRHSYKKHQALSGVSFQIHEGSVHGFVGPNGAGKTTTLKILATLLKPQHGSVRVFGHDVVQDCKQVRRIIGFMPDHFSMYRQMTVFEYLDFFGAAYGLNMDQRNAVIKDVLELTDMYERRDDLIKGLSRGMEQRVSLARVLVHDPKVLFLDEPASGLDPRARIELMDILTTLREMGKTVFISSHILSELGDLCDSFTIIDRGETKYCGPRAGLRALRGNATYILEATGHADEIREQLEALEGIDSVKVLENHAQFRIRFDDRSADTNAILSTAIAAGATIVSFAPDAAELQRAFMDLTSPGVRES